MRSIILCSPHQRKPKGRPGQGLTAPGRGITLAPRRGFSVAWESLLAYDRRKRRWGMAMEWTHRTAVVNGIHIHYVTHGQGSPVILLHGWPEFWYSWRHQIPVLAERFEVIAPDLRGFGYSDKPLAGYDSRSAASDIYELARHLGHPRMTIVAHDIGARVAYRLTLDHEDTVERLVLLDATPPIQLLGSQVPQVIRERWHVYFHQQFDLPEKLLEGREEIEGVAKVLIMLQRSRPNSYRLMNSPTTRSCMRSVLEKQIVRRTNRLIRVRRLMCLLSIFCGFSFPT